MIHFENDYNKSIHPALLEILINGNQEHYLGYGMDQVSEQAKEKIKEATKCPQAQIAFLSGGTQTNQIVIDSMLQPYQGVIAADTGHINTHEAGAIEFTGHKVLTLPNHQGKIDVTELKSYLADFFAGGNHEHMVFPGMVYISHPTEYGTLYSKDELKAISEICYSYEIPLFIDGARLGYGLAAERTDVDLPTIAQYAEVFYIGGTKMGAFIGEAVIFTKNNMPKHFVTVVKQHGALLAKGWLIGAQFDRFFTDDLYFEIGKHAIKMAEELKIILRKKGYQFYLESPTNQQFIIVENHKLEELSQVVAYSFWEKYDDDHTVIRLATSWSTQESNIEALKNVL